MKLTGLFSARQSTQPHAAHCGGCSLSAALLGAALLTASCSTGLEPAEYPEGVTLHAKSITLEINDTRKTVATPVTEPQVMTQGEDDTYTQRLPPGFENAAKSRLAKLTGNSGPNIVVHAEVRKAEVTFYNDRIRGDFTRYDVVVGFRVTSERGALFDKGSGGNWQEMPSEQATGPEMNRMFEATSIAAFDQYFASEDTLDTINEQIGRYLETHPEER